MEQKTYLEDHLGQLRSAYATASELRQGIHVEEETKEKVRRGENFLIVSANYGEYPVFDAMLKNGQRVHFALNYTGEDVDGLKRFRVHHKEGWGDEYKSEDAKIADPPVLVRFEFPSLKNPEVAHYRGWHVTFESEPYRMAGGSSHNDKGNTMRNDFSIFMSALSRIGWEDCYEHQDVIPRGTVIDKTIAGMGVMNTSGDCGYINFHMPPGARMTLVERADYTAKVLELFFRVKGYTPIPKDIGAVVQEWHDCQGQKINGMKSQLELKLSALEEINTQGFSEPEVHYLATLISTLKEVAHTYLELKGILGDDIVFEPLIEVCKTLPSEVPSERSRLLGYIINSLKKALEEEDELKFKKNLKAIVAILSKIEQTARGNDEASSSTGWEWASPLLLTERSTV